MTMTAFEEEVLNMSDDSMSEVYKKVFSSSEGQIVLEDMKNRFYIKASSAVFIHPETGNKHVNEPHTTYLNEGMRMAFQHIQARLDHKPQQERTEE